MHALDILKLVIACVIVIDIAMKIIESVCWMVQELGSEPGSDPNSRT